MRVLAFSSMHLYKLHDIIASPVWLDQDCSRDLNLSPYHGFPEKEHDRPWCGLASGNLAGAHVHRRGHESKLSMPLPGNVFVAYVNMCVFADVYAHLQVLMHTTYARLCTYTSPRTSAMQDVYDGSVVKNFVLRDAWDRV